ncbi:MAG TPA: hypothetical protein VFO67_18035, partial [Gemmatimonadales bacterium]|nr:hypothetical protein [Gemmatimonadales bacterium]
MTSTVRHLTAALILASVPAACDKGPPPAPPGGGGGPVTRPTVPQTYRPSGHMLAGDVAVHLFEWRWADIAAECET